MKKRGKAPWWVYALAAVVWTLGGGIWFHRERLDGLDVMVALVCLANAVIQTVRAVHAFRGRRENDTVSTNDSMIINGGETHD